MEIQERILKALKDAKTYRVRCSDCLIASFYLTSVGKKYILTLMVGLLAFTAFVLY